MKKYFLLTLVAAMMVALPANAGLKWGLKAGVNLASVSFNEDELAGNIDPGNYTGFQVGPIVEFTVPVVGIGMDVALLYSQDGFKMPKVDLIAVDEETMTTGSLLIPLNLKYKLSILNLVGAYATFGPYASFSISDNFGDYKDTFESKSFGAGLNFGLGAELLGKIQVGANYQLGLTDNYSSYENASPLSKAMSGAKTRVWSITAALFF